MNKDIKFVIICWIIVIVGSITIYTVISNMTKNSLDDDGTFIEFSDSKIPCVPNPIVWKDGVTHWPQGAVLCEEK